MVSPLLQKIEILLGKTDENNEDLLQMSRDGNNSNSSNTDQQSSSLSRHRNERLLIVMILLQRIPEDTRPLSSQKYETLLLDTQLLSFCERLLNHLLVNMEKNKSTIHQQHHSTTTNDDCWANTSNHNNNILIRWIVQYYSQCVVGLSTTLVIIHNNNDKKGGMKLTSSSTNLNDSIKQFHHIWESLVKILQYRIDHSTWEEVDLDVVSALQDCLDISSALDNNPNDDNSPNTIDRSRNYLHPQTLVGVWKRFQHMMITPTTSLDQTTHATDTTATSTTTTPASSTSTKLSSSETTTISNNTTDMTPNQDFQQMMDTLETLLVVPKSPSYSVQQQQVELEQDVHVLIQKLMTQHAATAIYPLRRHSSTTQDGTAVFPLWFTLLLSFVTNTTDASSESMTSSSCVLWPKEVLLRSFQLLIHHYDIPKDFLKEWMSSTLTNNTNNKNDDGNCPNKKDIVCLYSLLLMYITSSDNNVRHNKKKDPQDMQIVSWDILVTLIESCGWQWIMMMDHSKTTPLTMTTPRTESEQLVKQPASNFCMILRLATGEFRIRLGLLLEQLQQEQNVHSESIETRLFVLESCGRLAIAGLEYVIQLADATAEDESTTMGVVETTTTPLPLPADALLHIRQSLRDILDATMQYLLIDEFIPPQHKSGNSNIHPEEEHQSQSNKSHHIHKVHELVCRIFGTVLTELIPDLMVSSTPSSSSTSSDQLHQQQEDTLSSTLQAIHAALLLIQYLNHHHQQQQQQQSKNSKSSISMGVSSPSSIRMVSYLLPCLTTIYTNIDRKILDENQLLGAHDKNNMVMGVLSSHLSSCLLKAGNNNGNIQDKDDHNNNGLDIFSSISWTCHVIEAWCDVANPPNYIRRSMVKPLLDWISDLVSVIHKTNGITLMSQKGPSSEVLSLLNIVLGCYMALLGETIVDSDFERRLIEQALRCL